MQKLINYLHVETSWMDDLVMTNILRFLDQKSLIICYSVNPQFQRCTQSLIKVNWNNFFLACQQGDRNLIQWMIEKGANYWNYGLEGACQGGHRKLAEWMIEKGATYWDYGLYGACRGGHRELAEWMIEKGANNWDWGLEGACRRGHRDLAEWMIKSGANDWNSGLNGACQGGQRKLAEWMLVVNFTKYTLEWGTI